jgi:hypothetical protein
LAFFGAFHGARTVLASNHRNYIMTPTYVWQQFYQQAILETDRGLLPVLIKGAQAAIDLRIDQLRFDESDSTAEREAIADALTGLRVLERELKPPRGYKRQHGGSELTGD